MRQSQANYSRQRKVFSRLWVKEPDGCCERGMAKSGLRSSPVLPLIGGGTTKFQPVFVGDMTAGLLEVLRRSETAVEDLNDLMRIEPLRPAQNCGVRTMDNLENHRSVVFLKAASRAVLATAFMVL